MPEFTNEEGLRNWLGDKPVEWSRVVALRASLRVIPLLAESREFDGWSDFVLPLFRSSFLSALIAGDADEAGRLQDSVRAAAADAAAAAGLATTRIPASAAAAAATAAGAADVSAAADAAAAVSELYGYAAYFNSQNVTFSATDPDAASEAGSAARHAFWSTIIRDADMLEGGTPPERLALVHLWSGKQPLEVIRAAWSDLKEALIARNENWEVWTEWYEAVRDRHSRWGLSSEGFRVVALRIVGQEGEWWRRGPAAVNADIRAWIEEARLNAGGEEARQFDDLPIPQTIAGYVQELLDKSEHPLTTKDISEAFRAADFSVLAKSLRGALSSLTTGGRIARVSRGVYASMKWWADFERTVDSEPQFELPRSTGQLVAALAQVASPSATINSHGQLDAGPNPVFDRPDVVGDLASLPHQQRIVGETIAGSLSRNAPPVVRRSFDGYCQHLLERGAQPIVGLLQQLGGAIRRAYEVEEGELWGAGLEELFESFFANHELLIRHFPLSEEREQLFSETEVDEGAATYEELTKPVADVLAASEDAHAGRLTTDEFVKIINALAQLSRDTSSLPREPSGQPGTVVTPRRRFVLTAIGFFERVYNLVGATASIAATPQGIALLAVLGNAIQSLLKLVV